MLLVRAAGVVIMLLLAASPASAQAVPDGAALLDITLLGAGVAGLLLGRFGSRSRGPRD